MGLGPKEIQLRKNIRYVAVLTLQVRLFPRDSLTQFQTMVSSLISLPTPDEYNNLVEKHRDNIKKQIEETRNRAVNQSQQKTLKSSSSMPAVTGASSSSAQPSPKNVTRMTRQLDRKPKDEGWTPQNVA